MIMREESVSDRIVASAAKLFAIQGFEGTTTRQIVADAGSSLSAIQAHFKSKECLYSKVIEHVLDVFFSLNEEIFKEIDEAEHRGILNRQTAWNLLIQLINQNMDWILSGEYTSEILLLNRELLQTTNLYEKAPGSVMKIYLYYQKLFNAYIGEKDTFWAKSLSFSTVASQFDYINYKNLLENITGCNLELEQNRQMVKVYFKNYVITCVQANLNTYLQGRDEK